jgi:hypothetical protein
MSNYFNRSNLALLLLVGVVLSSCNNEAKKDDDTTTTTTSAPPGAALSGTLDNLYVKRIAFDSLGNGSKIVFSHTLASGGKILLDGFKSQGNDFNPKTPVIQLQYSSVSTTSYGPGVYFTNVVLDANNFNAIKTALGDSATSPNKFVIFKPKADNTYTGFIKYEIFVSPTSSFTAESTAAATADANPSPPKAS